MEAVRGFVRGFVRGEDFFGMDMRFLNFAGSLYNCCMKITTKKGDKGRTGLYGGRRVAKDDAVIEVFGELDELMCFLGLCKFAIGHKGGKDVCGILDQVQDHLYGMMGAIGGAGGARDGVGRGGGGGGAIAEEDVVFLEGMISKYGSGVRELKGFVEPGKNEVSARFHVARAVCRRAERRVVSYFRKGGEVAKADKDLILKYLNRLGDLLFVVGEGVVSP